MPLTSRRRWPAVAVAVVALGAFGPYVFSGFRTEQILVYGTCVALAAGIWWTKLEPNHHGMVVFSLLTLLLAVSAISAFDPPPNTTPYGQGDMLASFDNLALPIAAIATVWMLLAAGLDRQRLIRIASWVTVWAMVVNAGLAAWATGGSGPDLAIFQGPAGVESVAYLAEQLGRFSGIFNQPAEAGLMYSVALIAAIYLYRRHAVLLAVTSTILSIGGVLTVSKIFLFVGLPLGLWQAVRSSGGRQRRMAALLAMVIVAWSTAKSGLTPEWTGGNFLLRLLPGGDQGAVDLYTAGRYGGDSDLSVAINAILRSSPTWGFGAAGLAVAYDNAWVEALAIAGLFGAVLLTAIMLVLAHAWWTSRKTVEDREARFAGGLVVVIIGAATGLPSLTANRCSTIVWLLLAALLLSRRPSPAEPVCPVGVDAGLRVGAVQYQ